MLFRSYCGRIDFGIIACKEAVPDLHDFASAITGGFDELIALAEAKVALEKERGEVIEIAANAPLHVAEVNASKKTASKATAKPAFKAKTISSRQPTIRPASKPLSKRSTTAR